VVDLHNARKPTRRLLLPSSLPLLWLLKSERKFSGLTCQLDQLQPLPKTQNILLPLRLLRFVLHVP